MADWAQFLTPSRDYLADARGHSSNVSQKLSLKKPMPVEKSEGAAAIEGAVGGGLAAFSAMGAMGKLPGGGAAGEGAPVKSGLDKFQTQKPVGDAGVTVTPEEPSYMDQAAPDSVSTASAGNAGMGRFFSWAWS